MKSPDLPCTPELVSEALVRLRQIRDHYTNCLEANERCLAISLAELPWYDAELHALVLKEDGELVVVHQFDKSEVVKQIGADAVFKPAAILPGVEQPATKTAAEEKLAADASGFYYAASYLWDHLEQSILGKKKSRFIGVKMVRNRLLEHATNSSGVVYSFAASDSVGPVVGPVRVANLRREPLDRGLFLNVHELLSTALKSFEGWPKCVDAQE